MKETYDILFSVAIRHTYFDDGYCPSFDIRPDSFTTEILRKNGLVFRATRSGFVVLAKTDTSAASQMLSPQVDRSIQFNFLLKLKDPRLLNITEINEADGHSLRLYSNNLTSEGTGDNEFLFKADSYARIAHEYFKIDEGIAADGIFRKSTEEIRLERVSGHEDTLFSTKGLDHGKYTLVTEEGQSFFYLSSRSFDIKPFGLISIDLDNESVITEDGRMKQPSYTLQLESKSTFWQYIIHSGRQQGDLVVEAVNGQQEFDRSEEIINGDLTATLFTSRQEIAISESRSEYFRLKTRNGDPSNDTVLISKLPVPDMGVLNRTRNGKTYTPIYVNF